MKVKMQERHRRALRCFGFREPYKVICDGTFVYYSVLNHITPHTALVNTLGSAVKVFTTRCVVEELTCPGVKNRLGASYSESLDAASSLFTARCGHNNRKSVVPCITEVIGKNNPEHFFVATGDANLRKQLQQIHGVPVIYVRRDALFLEPPSTLQQQYKELIKRKWFDEGASEEGEGHGLEVQNIKTSVKRRKFNLKERKPRTRIHFLSRRRRKSQL